MIKLFISRMKITKLSQKLLPYLQYIIYIYISIYKRGQKSKIIFIYLLKVKVQMSSDEQNHDAVYSNESDDEKRQSILSTGHRNSLAMQDRPSKRKLNTESITKQQNTQQNGDITKHQHEISTVLQSQQSQRPSQQQPPVQPQVSEEDANKQSQQQNQQNPPKLQQNQNLQYGMQSIDVPEGLSSIEVFTGSARKENTVDIKEKKQKRGQQNNSNETVAHQNNPAQTQRGQDKHNQEEMRQCLSSQSFQLGSKQSKVAMNEQETRYDQGHGRSFENSKQWERRNQMLNSSQKSSNAKKLVSKPSYQAGDWPSTWKRSEMEQETATNDNYQNFQLLRKQLPNKIQQQQTSQQGQEQNQSAFQPMIPDSNTQENQQSKQKLNVYEPGDQGPTSGESDSNVRKDLEQTSLPHEQAQQINKDSGCTSQEVQSLQVQFSNPVQVVSSGVKTYGQRQTAQIQDLESQSSSYIGKINQMIESQRGLVGENSKDYNLMAERPQGHTGWTRVESAQDIALKAYDSSKKPQIGSSEYFTIDKNLSSLDIYGRPQYAQKQPMITQPPREQHESAQLIPSDSPYTQTILSLQQKLSNNEKHNICPKNQSQAVKYSQGDIKNSVSNADIASSTNEVQNGKKQKAGSGHRKSAQNSQSCKCEIF